MDRAEALLLSAGETIQQASALAQRNAMAIDALTVRIEALTDRVDSLAASGERHDRILDYLIRREGEPGRE